MASCSRSPAGKREPQVVVELGLGGNRLDRALQQRQRRRDILALVEDHAQEMLRQRMAGLNGKRFPVDLLGGRGVALLMQCDRLLDAQIQRRGRRRVRRLRGAGLRRTRRQRAVAILVALAAAAGTRIVSSRRRHRGQAAARGREPRRRDAVALDRPPECAERSRRRRATGRAPGSCVRAAQVAASARSPE